MSKTKSASRLLAAHSVLDKGQAGSPCRVHSFLIKDDGKGSFPNNEKLPLLVYEQSVDLKAAGGGDPAAVFEQLVVKHKWGDAWRDGVYPYHHYHSTAHEGLGVFAGKATVQFGGDDGISHTVEAGDTIIIPAGVAHKCLEQTDDFGVVGFYPRGQQVDMNYGKPDERPAADERISTLALPEEDPLFGADGPLLTCWNTSSSSSSSSSASP